MPEAFIDITRPLGAETAAWPGDTPFEMHWTQGHGEDAAAVSCVRFSPHLGTHLDAPLHLDRDGHDVAGLPLSACYGPCEVVALSGHARPIGARDLLSGWSPAAPRVLFATGTWPVGGPIPPRFATLEPELVEWLARMAVVLIGLDTPSIDQPGAPGLPAHRRCLERSVVILEGLDLTGVPPGLYTLVAAPLRLSGVEASPVRAFLLPAQPGP